MIKHFSTLVATLRVVTSGELVPRKEAKERWDLLMAGKDEWSSIGKQRAGEWIGRMTFEHGRDLRSSQTATAKGPESMADWQDRITSDPNVCHGKPCVKGTRVMVSVVIDNLAAGESHESIIRGYHIEEEDIQAALRYAADLARDRVVAVPTGAV